MKTSARTSSRRIATPSPPSPLRPLPFSAAFADDLAALTPDAQVELAMLVWRAIHRRESFEYMCLRYLVSRAQKTAFMSQMYGWCYGPRELHDDIAKDREQDDYEQLQQRIETLKARCTELETTMRARTQYEAARAARATRRTAAAAG